MDLKKASAAELTVPLFHDLLRLRVDVFVVEQECPYPELDGRDLEAGTTHLWIESNDGEVVSTIRLLTDPDCGRIGRVATSAHHRGHGHAAALMNAAIDLCDGPIELAAQSYLAEWYRGFGFSSNGDEFIEDDIPHIPMRRPA